MINVIQGTPNYVSCQGVCMKWFLDMLEGLFWNVDAEGLSFMKDALNMIGE